MYPFRWNLAGTFEQFKANISKKPAESCGIPVISRLKTHSLTAHVPTIQRTLEELPSYALP